MKNILIIIVIVLFSINSYSQINLKNKIQYYNRIVKITDNTFKYYNINWKNNTVQFFNLDNTLWKTVSLKMPEDVWLNEVLHISTNKLNQDSLIEIVYSTYKEVYSNIFDDIESIVHQQASIIIINENGEELLNVKDGSSFKCINDAESGKLILIDVNSNSEFVADRKTYVYSVY